MSMSHSPLFDLRAHLESYASSVFLLTRFADSPAKVQAVMAEQKNKFAEFIRSARASAAGNAMIGSASAAGNAIIGTGAGDTSAQPMLIDDENDDEYLENFNSASHIDMEHEAEASAAPPAAHPAAHPAAASSTASETTPDIFAADPEEGTFDEPVFQHEPLSSLDQMDMPSGMEKKIDIKLRDSDKDKIFFPSPYAQSSSASSSVDHYSTNGLPLIQNITYHIPSQLYVLGTSSDGTTLSTRIPYNTSIESGSKYDKSYDALKSDSKGRIFFYSDFIQNAIDASTDELVRRFTHRSNTWKRIVKNIATLIWSHVYCMKSDSENDRLFQDFVELVLQMNEDIAWTHVHTSCLRFDLARKGVPISAIQYNKELYNVIVTLDVQRFHARNIKIASNTTWPFTYENENYITADPGKKHGIANKKKLHEFNVGIARDIVNVVNDKQQKHVTALPEFGVDSFVGRYGLWTGAFVGKEISHTKHGLFITFYTIAHDGQKTPLLELSIQKIPNEKVRISTLQVGHHMVNMRTLLPVAKTSKINEANANYVCGTFFTDMCIPNAGGHGMGYKQIIMLASKRKWTLDMRGTLPYVNERNRVASMTNVAMTKANTIAHVTGVSNGKQPFHAVDHLYTYSSNDTEMMFSKNSVSYIQSNPHGAYLTQHLTFETDNMARVVEEFCSTHFVLSNQTMKIPRVIFTSRELLQCAKMQSSEHTPCIHRKNDPDPDSHSRSNDFIPENYLKLFWKYTDPSFDEKNIHTEFAIFENTAPRIEYAKKSASSSSALKASLKNSMSHIHTITYINGVLSTCETSTDQPILPNVLVVTNNIEAWSNSDRATSAMAFPIKEIPGVFEFDYFIYNFPRIFEPSIQENIRWSDDVNCYDAMVHEKPNDINKMHRLMLDESEVYAAISPLFTRLVKECMNHPRSLFVDMFISSNTIAHESSLRKAMFLLHPDMWKTISRSEFQRLTHDEATNTEIKKRLADIKSSWITEDILPSPEADARLSQSELARLKIAYFCNIPLNSSEQLSRTYVSDLEITIALSASQYFLPLGKVNTLEEAMHSYPSDNANSHIRHTISTLRIFCNLLNDSRAGLCNIVHATAPNDHFKKRYMVHVPTQYKLDRNNEMSHFDRQRKTELIEFIENYDDLTHEINVLDRVKKIIEYDPMDIQIMHKEDTNVTPLSMSWLNEKRSVQPYGIFPLKKQLKQLYTRDHIAPGTWIFRAEFIASLCQLYPYDPFLMIGVVKSLMFSKDFSKPGLNEIMGNEQDTTNFYNVWRNRIIASLDKDTWSKQIPIVHELQTAHSVDVRNELQSCDDILSKRFERVRTMQRTLMTTAALTCWEQKHHNTYGTKIKFDDKKLKIIYNFFDWKQETDNDNVQTYTTTAEDADRFPNHLLKDDIVILDIEATARTVAHEAIGLWPAFETTEWRHTIRYHTFKKPQQQKTFTASNKKWSECDQKWNKRS